MAKVAQIPDPGVTLLLRVELWLQLSHVNY